MPKPVSCLCSISSGRQIQFVISEAALRILVVAPETLAGQLDTGAGTKPTDMVISRNDRFLYVLDSGTHGHGMDELSQLWLGHAPIAFKTVAGTGKAQKSFKHVELKPATCYAAEDADVTLRLWSVLKPRLSVMQPVGAIWSTNALGMRDRPYTRAKPPNTVRIGLMGDSIGAVASSRFRRPRASTATPGRRTTAPRKTASRA